jgi:hypothetical protein
MLKIQKFLEEIEPEDEGDQAYKVEWQKKGPK